MNSHWFSSTTTECTKPPPLLKTTTPSSSFFFVVFFYYLLFFYFFGEEAKINNTPNPVMLDRGCTTSFTSCPIFRMRRTLILSQRISWRTQRIAYAARIKSLPRNFPTLKFMASITTDVDSQENSGESTIAATVPLYLEDTYAFEKKAFLRPEWSEKMNQN